MPTHQDDGSTRSIRSAATAVVAASARTSTASHFLSIGLNIGKSPERKPQ